MEQLGCWFEPSLPDGQAARLLHHFVVHPMVDGLSVEQKHGLDVPPFGHRWAVNIHTLATAALPLQKDLDWLLLPLITLSDFSVARVQMSRNSNKRKKVI